MLLYTVPAAGASGAAAAVFSHTGELTWVRWGRKWMHLI